MSRLLAALALMQTLCGPALAASTCRQCMSDYMSCMDAADKQRRKCRDPANELCSNKCGHNQDCFLSCFMAECSSTVSQQRKVCRSSMEQCREGCRP